MNQNYLTVHYEWKLLNCSLWLEIIKNLLNFSQSPSNELRDSEITYRVILITEEKNRYRGFLLHFTYYIQLIWVLIKNYT